MSIYQKTIKLHPRPRGFHLITKEIEEALFSFPDATKGILNIFLKHTSASITINENADFDTNKEGDALAELDDAVNV